MPPITKKQNFYRRRKSLWFTELFVFVAYDGPIVQSVRFNGFYFFRSEKQGCSALFYPGSENAGHFSHSLRGIDKPNRIPMRFNVEEREGTTNGGQLISLK